MQRLNLCRPGPAPPFPWITREGQKGLTVSERSEGLRPTASLLEALANRAREHCLPVRKGLISFCFYQRGFSTPLGLEKTSHVDIGAYMYISSGASMPRKRHPGVAASIFGRPRPFRTMLLYYEYILVTPSDWERTNKTQS